jgi:Acetyltransferases
LLVAEVDGITAGLLHAEIRRTPPYACFVQHTYAEVVDLFVTERLRGNGIGSALLAGAEQWSDNHNIDYLELSVLQNNERAIKFYTNHKFKYVSYLIRK